MRKLILATVATLMTTPVHAVDWTTEIDKTCTRISESDMHLYEQCNELMRASFERVNRYLARFDTTILELNTSTLIGRLTQDCIDQARRRHAHFEEVQIVAVEHCIEKKRGTEIDE